mgnify:CR=1 FL=1
MNPTNIQRVWMSERMAFAVDFALLGGCLHRVDLLTAFPWRVTLMVGFWNLPANASSHIFLDWSRLACLLLRAEKPISEDTNPVVRAVIKNPATPVSNKIHLRWLVLANKGPINVRLAAYFCSIRSISHSLSSPSIHRTSLNNIRNMDCFCAKCHDGNFWMNVPAIGWPKNYWPGEDSGKHSSVVNYPIFGVIMKDEIAVKLIKTLLSVILSCF